MNDYTRREVVTRRVEFEMDAPPPWGVHWVDVSKLIHIVIQDMRDQGRLGSSETPSDDAISLHPRDDAIVVSYKIEERISG